MEGTNNPQTIFRIFIKSTALLHLWEFASLGASFNISQEQWQMSRGFLLCTIGGNTIHVEDAIGAAHGTLNSVKLTSEDRVIIKKYTTQNPGTFLGGWFHTRPGGGIHLSDSDAQNQQFYQQIYPAAFALVFDNTRIGPTSLGFSLHRLHSAVANTSYEILEYQLEGMSREILKQGLGFFMKPPFPMDSLWDAIKDHIFIPSFPTAGETPRISRPLEEQIGKKTQRYECCERCGGELKEGHIHQLPKPVEERMILQGFDALVGEKNLCYDIEGGHVTALCFYAAGLTSLPEDIGKLPKLEHLNLWGNQIIVLPTWLQQLHSLKSLAVAYNRLCEFPSEILKLNNLQELDLSYNYIPSVPPEIRKLHALCNIRMVGNLFHKLPDEFCQLANLSTLTLARNPLSSLPSNFGDLSQLMTLDLRDTYLKDFPQSFGRLRSLQTLKLTKLPPGNISPLVWLPDLHKLYFDAEVDEDRECEITPEREEQEEDVFDALERKGVEVKYKGDYWGDDDYEEFLSFPHSFPTPKEVREARRTRKLLPPPPNQKRLADFFSKE